MQLYQIKLRPLSAWRTPWQADTLAGLLCLTMARTQGAAALRAQILDHCANPPFVLSDAFPGDYLPVPEVVRLQQWEEAARRPVKRAAWLSVASFTKAQRGIPLTLEDFISTATYETHTQTHNTLDRFSDTTGTEGSLFQKPETVLSAEGLHLSVYARVTEAFKPTLLTLFQQLAETGFGADTSIGKGQFEWLGCEPVTVLDEVANANGAIALSTFQPAPGDPTKGFWEAFVKYGKVAPDPGVANVFKRPLVMLQPGACFKTDVARSYLGRAIPMDELLPAEEANQLRTRGINLTQWAFGLTVPAHFTQEELWSEL